MAEQLQPKVLRQIMKELKEMSESPPEGITVRPREAARAPAPPRPVPIPDARRAHLQVVINEEKVADVQGVIAGPGACRCEKRQRIACRPPRDANCPADGARRRRRVPVSVARRCHPRTVRTPLVSVAARSLFSLAVGTPFEGGVFRMRLALPADYPASPPKGFFMTKIFHPNVAEAGDICVNTLKRDWDPSHGLRHIFQVVRCLLIEPFPESALNDEAGKLLIEDYEVRVDRARCDGVFAPLVAERDWRLRRLVLTELSPRPARAPIPVLAASAHVSTSTHSFERPPCTQEYNKRAKLMTSIYAKPAKTQKMPLTVNSANTADGGAGVGGEKDVTSQPVKKAAVQKKVLLRKKSSLKRL